MQALDELGHTLKDLVQVAIMQPTEDAARRALQALKDIGKSAVDILKAAIELPLSQIALSSRSFSTGSPEPIGRSAPPSAPRRPACSASSIDLDKVKIAVKSLPVDLIETLNGGRTFTTMYLLNFASWDKVTLDTLIHELTHVWQGLQEGPVYMIEALEAQLIGQGYNYGYDETGDGEEFGTGGRTRWRRPTTISTSSTRSSRRRSSCTFMRARRRSPPRDVSAWQPYANVVFA